MIVILSIYMYGQGRKLATTSNQTCYVCVLCVFEREKPNSSTYTCYITSIRSSYCMYM